MSERAAALAAAFERANDEVIAAAEASGDRWQVVCSDEGWSVGVTAHHVGVSHAGIFGLVKLIANGQPVPELTMDDFDALNARHAQEFANCTREETVELLRRDGKAVADGIRALSDEQLDRSAPMAFAGGQPWSAADVIERILIGHPIEHGRSIRAARGS